MCNESKPFHFVTQATSHCVFRPGRHFCDVTTHQLHKHKTGEAKGEKQKNSIVHKLRAGFCWSCWYGTGKCEAQEQGTERGKGWEKARIGKGVEGGGSGEGRRERRK